MKIRVEFSTKAVGNTPVLHGGTYDTDIEKDGLRFLDIMEIAVLCGDDFISLSVRRLNDAEVSTSPVQGSNLV